MKVFTRERIGKLAAFCCALSALFLWSGTASAALSADDFLPPVQAEAGQAEALLAVQDEASVKTAVDPVLNVAVTTAATLQDAINKVIEKPGEGCQILAEPGGGYAFVATGLGTYNAKHENVTASRIEQRNAYVAAFMNAKAQMAMTVGGIVVRGATDFDRKIDRLNTEAKALVNIETELSEEQFQTARKVLKGYVTYAVKDNGNGAVYVTIVSSSKTRGKFSRMGTDGVTAGSLREGLNSVIAEIKNGFVPPVGGRIIDVPGTGEVAFVGFGSSVVQYDEEADVQEELKMEAERIASMRAVDALAGIVLGDDTSWQGHADETTVQGVRSFERQQASDQTTKGSPAEIQAYEERKRTFRNNSASGAQIQSLRQGVLPPGVMRETSLSDDDYFAYGIAVYIPSVTEAAKGVSKEMDDAQLVQPSPTQTGGASSSGSAGQEPEKKPTPEIKEGPSGVVDQVL